MPLQPQRDEEMAEKYVISVEVLREGMPRSLHRAPDGQIVFGARLSVRVATAKQLEESLDLVLAASSTSAPPAALDCYIVPYLPPREALELRELWLQRVDGEPNIAVRNMSVLEAKEEALARIQQKITDVRELIGVLQNIADGLLVQHENPSGYVEHLFSLKIRYVLCVIRSGDIDTAKSLLSDVPGIEGNAADFEPERILELADELSELYLEDLEPVAEDLVSDQICKLILGEVCSSDWRDMMQMIDDDPRLLKCIQDTIVELQRRVALYEELTTEPSLIGASHVDFGEL